MVKRTSVKPTVTKLQLADKIEAAIKDAVSQFVAQKSPEALEAQKRFDELEEQKRMAAKALKEGSVAYIGAASAIEKEQKNLDVSDSHGNKSNRIHAAWAVVHACNNLKLPVALKQTKDNHSNGNGVGGRKIIRRTPEAIAADKKAILKTLSTKEFTSTADIKAKSGISESRVLSMTLQSLAVDKLAKSNKKKGSAGAWKKL